MEDELSVDCNYIPDIIKVFEESRDMLDLYHKQCQEAIAKAQKENVTNETNNPEHTGQ
jgi:hypothetical protein